MPNEFTAVVERDGDWFISLGLIPRGLPHFEYARDP